MAATTPSTFGRRYAPLLVLAAVQLLAILIVPSLPNTGDSQLATGASNGIVRNANGEVIDPATGEVLPDGTVTDPGATGTATGTGTGSGTGTATGTGKAGTGAGPAAGGPAAGPAAAADLSHCQKNGQQIGPTFYMPK
jgi:hypothetical protein